jgi:hypothetical protein
MARKRKVVHRRKKRAVGGTHRRRTTRRRSKGMLGAIDNNFVEKVAGIGVGAGLAVFLEEQLEKHRPGMNPTMIGVGEIAVGAFMSGKPGLMGFVGDGMIAAGTLNLIMGLKKRMKHGGGGGVHGPEYVIDGTDYVTGYDIGEAYVTEDGFVITGDGSYVTGPDGEYMTEDSFMGYMGAVNQGGLGAVNQGGLG